MNNETAVVTTATDNNIFGFNYVETRLANQDSTDSIWSSVFGEGGKLIHCKKQSYQMIDTESVSKIADAFKSEGLNVTPFIHRNGEIIGLNVDIGNIPSVVGEKNYRLVLKMKNNGSGKGVMMVKERVMICGNGMIINGSSYMDSNIKIPHSFGYEYALNLMKEAVIQFHSILDNITLRDELLNKNTLTKVEVIKLLNKWFYQREMPVGHKENMSLAQFRELLYNDPKEIKCIDRYNQLMVAFNKELGYNEVLDRPLSSYTVYATITNYISRRIEASQSKQPTEIQFENQSAKLKGFQLV